MREYRHKDEKTFHWVSFTYSGFIWVYTLPAKVWNCCSSASQAQSGLAKPNAKVYFEVEKRVNIIEQRYVNWLMRNDVSFTFVILPLHVLTFHFFFVTDNVQKWQRGDHFFPFRESNSLILSAADLLWQFSMHSSLPNLERCYRSTKFRQ